MRKKKVCQVHVPLKPPEGDFAQTPPKVAIPTATPPKLKSLSLKNVGRKQYTFHTFLLGHGNSSGAKLNFGGW